MAEEKPAVILSDELAATCETADAPWPIEPGQSLAEWEEAYQQFLRVTRGGLKA